MFASSWLGGAALVAAAASQVSFAPVINREAAQSASVPDIILLQEVIQALQTMQNQYFQPWLGTWPSAIDWTAAVTATHVAGTLDSLSQGLELVQMVQDEDYRVKENLLSLYFSHMVGSYFGQDAFAIRNEAFDDILWVVLQWLDTIRFIDLHTALYYPMTAPQTGASVSLPNILRNQTWHGNVWIPAFAHRARIFEELAMTGWDDVLCGGGMTWNPRLEPYKNAITNELFIAGSVSMYLNFPGDANTSPYNSSNVNPDGGKDPAAQGSVFKPHDPAYLKAAVKGYDWLVNSNMTNSQGLYVDGFHISGYRNRNNTNRKCDVRNEMVYTYNQGVLLTGQFGLFKATGNDTYLADGHKLVQSVIAATGWDLGNNRPVDDVSALRPGQLPPWHGIGRVGILEEACDTRGDCSQDSQTFKGIFFNHLTTFCASPASDAIYAGPLTAAQRSVNAAVDAHTAACASYSSWIRHNADAALGTRDDNGRFGMWWTVGLLPGLSTADLRGAELPYSSDAVDYRTYGVPNDPLWVSDPSSRSRRHQKPLATEERDQGSDPNTRGRGRTVETQGGGLAVLRTLWEIERLTWST
jgi:hypothetical protein